MQFHIIRYGSNVRTKPHLFKITENLWLKKFIKIYQEPKRKYTTPSHKNPEIQLPVG